MSLWQKPFGSLVVHDVANKPDIINKVVRDDNDDDDNVVV
jgi:hypothetical protein